MCATIEERTVTASALAQTHSSDCNREYCNEHERGVLTLNFNKIKKIKNKYKNRIMASALAAALGFCCVSTVYASAISDAQNKKNQAQSDLDAQNEKIDSLQNQRDSLQADIDRLDSELVNIIVNMSILEEELADKEDELERVSADLKEAEENERTQYNNMKKRIRYMYENGETSFLEIVLGATDFADFLNRVEYASQVYGHDRELLTSYQETVQQVADLKLQVEGEKAELEQMHSAYEEQEQEYQALISSKKSSMKDFDIQLASAREIAAEYKQVISEQNSIIQQEQERQRQQEEEERRRQEDQRRKEEEDRLKQQQSDNGNSNNQNSGGGDNNNGNRDSNSGGNNSGSSGSKKDSVGSGGSSKNPSFSTNISGGDVVNYACQFIGNPYVYGGTSLTDGCDCSGFVMSVYAHFGVSLPHSSTALQSSGKEVSYSNAQAGDLICYAGHVAIYMGNGQIVNASSPAPYPVGGIKTNSATYRQILTVRRVL